MSDTDKVEKEEQRQGNPLINFAASVQQFLHKLPGPFHSEQEAVSPNLSKDSRDSEAPLSLISSSAKPVSKEQLGRATWTLLHTIAAHYPESPSKKDRQEVQRLIHSLAETYPCADCASHFRQLLRRKPPKLDSHDDLELWMCQVHNDVNLRLDKPEFDCRRTSLRWGNADCDESGACAIKPLPRPS